MSFSCSNPSPSRNSDSSSSDVQRVIIPRGLVSPNQDAIIEIPDSLRRSPTIVAKPKPRPRVAGPSGSRASPDSASHPRSPSKYRKKVVSETTVTIGEDELEAGSGGCRQQTSNPSRSRNYSGHNERDYGSPFAYDDPDSTIYRDLPPLNIPNQAEDPWGYSELSDTGYPNTYSESFSRGGNIYDGSFAPCGTTNTTGNVPRSHSPFHGKRASHHPSVTSVETVTEEITEEYESPQDRQSNLAWGSTEQYQYPQRSNSNNISNYGSFRSSEDASAGYTFLEPSWFTPKLESTRLEIPCENATHTRNANGSRPNNGRYSAPTTSPANRTRHNCNIPPVATSPELAWNSIENYNYVPAANQSNRSPSPCRTKNKTCDTCTACIQAKQSGHISSQNVTYRPQSPQIETTFSRTPCTDRNPSESTPKQNCSGTENQHEDTSSISWFVPEIESTRMDSRYSDYVESSELDSVVISGSYIKPACNDRSDFTWREILSMYNDVTPPINNTFDVPRRPPEIKPQFHGTFPGARNDPSSNSEDSNFREFLDEMGLPQPMAFTYAPNVSSPYNRASNNRGNNLCAGMSEGLNNVSYSSPIRSERVNATLPQARARANSRWPEGMNATYHGLVRPQSPRGQFYNQRPLDMNETTNIAIKTQNATFGDTNRTVNMSGAGGSSCGSPRMSQTPRDLNISRCSNPPNMPKKCPASSQNTSFNSTHTVCGTGPSISPCARKAKKLDRTVKEDAIFTVSPFSTNGGSKSPSLEETEAAEIQKLEEDLKRWQDARRKLILDTSDLSTSGGNNCCCGKNATVSGGSTDKPPSP